MKKGLVSVVIPNYNYANYLRGAVDSVLAQTYPSIETIVVDDGSLDESKKVLGDYGDRITTVYQQNRGVSAARNSGARASRGEFLAFLDADDLWLPEKIEKQVERFANHEKLGLVHVGVVEIDAEDNPVWERVDGGQGWVGEDLLLFSSTGILGGGSGFMVPRRVFDEIGGFDERLSTSADWDFFYQLGSRYPVGFVAEILLKYRVHNSNMHSNVGVMERDMMLAFEKAFSCVTGDLSRLRRRAYGALHQNLAGSYFVSGKYPQFILHSVKSLAFDPKNIVHFFKFPKSRT